MIKTSQEIEVMRAGGKILTGILQVVAAAVRPGIATQALEELTRQLLENYPGATPAFLDYDKYPAALCVSINDEVVHAKPSGRLIQPGDLVSLDFGVKYQGLITDSAATVLVPGGDENSHKLKQKLLQTTQACLSKALAQAKPGKTLGDIGHAVQRHAEQNGFKVVYQLVGHGVGKSLHEEPQIPNFGQLGEGLKLVEGMTLAIEPMLVAGSPELAEDKTTLAWRTVDGSPAAHFEHTVAVTADGPLVLTKI